MPRPKRVAPITPTSVPPPPAPLSLDQLLAQMETFRSQHPDLAHRPVELPWDPGHTTLGPHPAIAFSGLSAGFDWDHGRVFLHATERVGQVPDELRRRLRIYEDAFLGIALEVRRTTDAPTKGLGSIQQRLDACQDRLRRLAEPKKPTETD